jgi:hypothetical protein
VNNGYRFCKQCGIDVKFYEKEKQKKKLIENLEASIETKLGK